MNDARIFYNEREIRTQIDIFNKEQKCRDFYNKLIKALEGRYEVVASSNQDISSYLVPNNTSKQISYYGKPIGSFRFSDHWNWYSNTKKCTNPNYIQCYSVDIPWPNKRPGYSKASKPKRAMQIAFYGKDNKYHHVYGEKYDRKTKEWYFIDAKLEDVLKLVEEKGC